MYKKYKAPFLSDIPGAKLKKLLIRNEDVQVVHGFDTVENAKGYLSSRLFNSDVVVALKPYLEGNPDVASTKRRIRKFGSWRQAQLRRTI